MIKLFEKKIAVARNLENKETDSKNFVQSSMKSHFLRVTLFYIDHKLLIFDTFAVTLRT